MTPPEGRLKNFARAYIAISGGLQPIASSCMLKEDIETYLKYASPSPRNVYMYL